MGSPEEARQITVLLCTCTHLSRRGIVLCWAIVLAGGIVQCAVVSYSGLGLMGFSPLLPAAGIGGDGRLPLSECVGLEEG